MRPEIFWIPGRWRGRLAIVARPRGGDWLDEEAEGWQRAGVDLVVSLLEPEETKQLDLLAEDKAAESRGIRFISFPIPDRGVPVSLPDFIALTGRLASELDAGKNVAVHCRQGIGRSGLLAAGILATSGIDLDFAIQTVSSARGLDIPETAEQRSWIQRLTTPSVLRR